MWCKQSVCYLSIRYRRWNSQWEVGGLDTELPDRIHPIKADSTKEEGMIEIARVISEEVSEIHYLVNCVGYLHNSDHGPEKLGKLMRNSFLKLCRSMLFLLSCWLNIS